MGPTPYSLSTLSSFPVLSSDKGGKFSLGSEYTSDQLTTHKHNQTLPSIFVRQDSTVKSKGRVHHESEFIWETLVGPAPALKDG